MTGFASGPIAGGVSYMPAYFHRELQARNRHGDKVWSVAVGRWITGVARGRESFEQQQRLYVSADDGFLYAFTTAGQLRWRRTIGDPGDVGAPVVLNSSWKDLIIVAGGQTLMAFRGDGTVAWSVALDGPALGSPALSDGRVYVATQKSLYAMQ